MSAEILREAAALMRSRAEAATPGPWESHVESGPLPEWAIWMPDAGCDKAFVDNDADAEHIASWHPAVAIAVADWLTDIANRHTMSAEPLDLYLHYDSDEECEQCEGGGHPTHVCDGCFPQWDGMDGYSKYPCRETTVALAVARAYLGEATDG